MENVSQLLTPHWGLIKEFSCFLPEGFKIDVLSWSLNSYRKCYVGDLSLPSMISKRDADELAGGFLQRIIVKLPQVHALAGLALAPLTLSPSFLSPVMSQPCPSPKACVSRLLNTFPAQNVKCTGAPQ